MVSLSTASNKLSRSENLCLSFYGRVFKIAPSSLDLENSLYLFKTVTGTRHPDGNMCCRDGATKHVQNIFLTHGRLQSGPDEIAHEPFCSLLFIARFNLINIRIS